MTQQSYHPEIYWDKVAEIIESRKDLKTIAGDDEPYYRYKRRRFLELLDTINFSGKAVLEVGSGPGGNIDFLYTKGCRKLTGVDISQQMISLARKLLAGKNVDLIKINGTDLPFDDKYFDAVFTSTVLQHNTDEASLQKICGEICRVSRGEVLLFERIENKIKGNETNLGRPLSYYSELLSKHGFELVDKRSLPIQASYYVCGVIRKLFNRRDRKEGEPPSKISIALQQFVLPFTSYLDKLIPSKRDVMLLGFKRPI